MNTEFDEIMELAMSPDAQNRAIAFQLAQGCLEDRQQQLRVRITCKVVDKAFQWSELNGFMEISSELLIQQAILFMRCGFAMPAPPHLPTQLCKALRSEFLVLAGNPVMIARNHPNLMTIILEGYFATGLAFKDGAERPTGVVEIKNALSFSMKVGTFDLILEERWGFYWAEMARKIQAFARKNFKTTVFEDECGPFLLEAPERIIINPEKFVKRD